jgi:hypothetical protein
MREHAERVSRVAGEIESAMELDDDSARTIALGGSFESWIQKSRVTDG